MSPRAGDLVGSTLNSGYVGQGPRVEEFERAFTDVIESPREALALNSCTSALDLALHLCDVGSGDEVVTTPVTCTATNTHIALRGARPVWADVDPITGLIDPQDVAGKVTTATKAVMVVDWGGRAAASATLRELLEDRGRQMQPPRAIPIIEDAAHALLGAGGGDYICWSFQAIKHLTTGDGGALVTPDEQLERARLLRWYGYDRRESESFRCAQDLTELGYKYAMNDVAASIGLANLPHAQDVVRSHRRNAAWYHSALAGLPGVTVPPADERSSWWLYTILVEDRDAFVAFAAEHGVEVSQVHARNDTHTAFRFPNGPLPGVDQFAAHQVCIPVGWWLTEGERQHVADVVAAWSRQLAPTRSAK